MDRPSEERHSGGARARRTTAIAALLAGVGIAFGLGVYAKAHAATGVAPIRLGFSIPGQMKVWFTRVAVILACIQLVSGLRINGRIRVPRRIPGWFRIAHRTSGGIAVLLAALVAYDCVAAFGFHAGPARVVLHGVVGFVFFGAFAAKVVSVQRKRNPSWLIPTIGVTLFLTLSLLWLTSLGWPVSIY
jgi:Family of unknown function (DUF6529)